MEIPRSDRVMGNIPITSHYCVFMLHGGLGGPMGCLGTTSLSAGARSFRALSWPWSWGTALTGVARRIGT